MSVRDVAGNDNLAVPANYSPGPVLRPQNTVFLMNRTALHCAVARCNTKMVEVLLKHNVDLKVRMMKRILRRPSRSVTVEN